MSLDITDMVPSSAMTATRDDADPSVTLITDAQLERDFDEMTDKINRYFRGMGPNDRHADRGVMLCREAISQLEIVLDEIHRRWKIKHFEGDP